MNSRPLLICDADEVLLKFFAAFENYLTQCGYTINMTSFALNGNIRDKHGEVLPRSAVTTIVDDFFEACVDTIEAVPGAVYALEMISKMADIIILTNIPAAQRDRRAASMKALGMAYPVIANAGSKGLAVRDLALGRLAPVLFIDDLPPHHAAVAEAAPQVHRLHMVADERLRVLVPSAPQANKRIDTWDEALAYIQSVFQAR